MINILLIIYYLILVINMEADIKGFVAKTYAIFSLVGRIYMYNHIHTYVNTERGYLEGEARGEN